MVKLQSQNGPPIALLPERTEPPKEARITWSPVGAESNVPFSGSSYLNVRKALIETFGPFPIVLRNPEHMIVLAAMAAAAGAGSLAYDTLRRALSNQSGIELRDL